MRKKKKGLIPQVENSKIQKRKRKASNNVSTRVWTGAAIVFFMLIGIFGGAYAYSILFLTINVLCLYEFLSMLLPTGTTIDKARFYLGIALGIAPFILTGLIQLNWITSFPVRAETIIPVVAFVLLLFTAELFARSDKPFYNIAAIILGVFYIGIPLSLLHFIAFPDSTYTHKFVISFVLVIWLNDTGSYFWGSAYGKTPYFPRISPRKTWEGTIGGFLTGLFTAFLISVFLDDLSLLGWLCFAVTVIVSGDIGDLVESMLKRSLHVKDSSGLLPGHGGFLDRFDAFIFAIPFGVGYLLLAG